MMSGGASVYQMITGLGDAFNKGYSDARQRAQEDEAPGLISNLISTYQGGAAPAGVGTPPSAAPTSAPASGKLPFFARAQGSLPSEKLNGLINDVATRNELDPGYLTKLVSIESGGNPNAFNKGSKASGLGQFIPSTAKAYGLTDPFDPAANLNATARLTIDNRAALRQALGRDPTPGELYLGHQQGAGGASRLLRNPDLPAARLVGMKAVTANGGTSDMTARDFASLWTSRFDSDTPQIAQSKARPVQQPQVPMVASAAAPALQALPAFVRPGGPAMTMPAAPAQQVAAPAPIDPGAADKPAPGAQPAGFVVPGQDVAPSAAPTPAPQAAPQGFAGFGAPASRVSPAMQDALKAAWRNPNTRPMATAIYGQMLKGQDSAWKLTAMGDQPVLFNERTAQIVPVGQAKRQTATVGNTVIDTATGQPIYRGEQDPKTATVGQTVVDLRTGQPIYQGEKDERFSYQAMPGVGMVALHPTDPTQSRVIIAGQQPRPMKPEEAEQFGKGYFDAGGAPHIPKPGVSVSIDNKGAGKFTEKANELQAKRYGDMQEAADNAVSLRADIDTMAALGEQISTGKLAEARLGLAQYAKAAGLDSIANGLTNGRMGEMEAYTALADKITPRMRVPGSGSTSDAEGRAFKNSLPSLLKSAEGNRIIVDTFRGMADYQAQAGDIAGRALRGEISQAEADQGIRALPSPYARFKEHQGKTGGGPSVAKGADRMPLPDGYTAARVLSEAKAALTGKGRNPADKAVLAERLRAYGIDPARLDQ